ncbi:MAG: NADH-quinone oxidoreductase subunit K [Campylobacterales bacterium]|nr:NADH-quinone oxidoreductase subunit K [Campylobacterales bacterium]
MFDAFGSSALLHQAITLLCFIIFGVALFGVLVKKNLFNIFLAFSIAEAALFLFFIGNHYAAQLQAPILFEGLSRFDPAVMVDPLPQAMILTTIVIGIAVLALALTFVIRYYKLTGHMRIDEMDELGEDR